MGSDQAGPWAPTLFGRKSPVFKRNPNPNLALITLTLITLMILTLITLMTLSLILALILALALNLKP